MREREKRVLEAEVEQMLISRQEGVFDSAVTKRHPLQGTLTEREGSVQLTSLY